MPVDEFEDFDVPPRKWLDKKQYVRVDPVTGEPQLISVEPVITEDGEFIPSSVTVCIDNGTAVVMDRDAAETYIENMDCTPLEIAAQYKHRKNN